MTAPAEPGSGGRGSPAVQAALAILRQALAQALAQPVEAYVAEGPQPGSPVVRTAYEPARRWPDPDRHGGCGCAEHATRAGSSSEGCRHVDELAGRYYTAERALAALDGLLGQAGPVVPAAPLTPAWIKPARGGKPAGQDSRSGGGGVTNRAERPRGLFGR